VKQKLIAHDVTECCMSGKFCDVKTWQSEKKHPWSATRQNSSLGLKK